MIDEGKETTMTGFTRATRASDFDMMQVLPAVVLVMVLLIGGDWVGEAADEAEAFRALHGQALGIAMMEADAAMKTEFEQLAPSAEFVAMPPVEMSAGDDAQDELVRYEVERRVSNLDAAGSLRRIEIRVGYQQAETGERTWVEIATVRQDWETAQAGAQKPRSRFAS
jgi:hypothetical protein